MGTVSYTHRMRFLERLGRGTVVFDGAMGTMLYARGVFLNRCFDELNLSNPDLVRAGPRRVPRGGGGRDRDEHLRRPPLQARARTASRRRSGRSTARARASRARRRGAARLVAGAIGPIGKPLEPIGNIPPAEAEAAYREQAEGLLEGGVDLFLLETMPSLDQAKAALAGRALAHERRAGRGEPDLQRGGPRPSTATRPRTWCASSRRSACR